MSIQSDQKYLRVRNISSQELYLSDLDDEENHEENKGVQVYVGAGEKADLPMDDDVIHSYEQGSIRGFIDQGLLDAAPYEGQKATLWVDPNGSDDNPGTRNAPLGSIQTAIDRLGEEVGLHGLKQIYINPGTYQTNLVINTANLQLIGLGTGDINQSSNRVQLETDDPSRPVATVTNMTDAGYENFESDGGVSYTWNAPSFSYDGASLDRPRVEGSTEFTANILFENIVFRHGDPSSTEVTNLQVLGAPNDNDEGYVSGVALQRCSLIQTSGASTAMTYYKNVEQANFRGVLYTFTGEAIFDHAFRPSIHPLGWSAEGFNLDEVVFRGDDTTDPDEGGVGFGILVGVSGVSTLLQSTANVSFIEGVGIRGDRGVTRIVTDTGTFLGSSSDNIGDANENVELRINTFDGQGSGDYNLDLLKCGNGSYSGSGVMDLNRLHVHSGNFTISGGSGHAIRGGTIQGDLILEGGSTGSLRGITIRGDLVIRDSGTQVDCEGCHVQGSVTIDTDTTDQTQNFYGGHIIGEGHTNEVRDPEGNDVSANADWNRVTGV